ncbi:helix-turn-helix domain-containing protein [Desulforamulus putei]|uniref:helix-turn-helix domain-containing protein n=1 Tax=Desulforamulus putei TaxID=74701 RepID=UPI002FDCC73F
MQNMGIKEIEATVLYSIEDVSKILKVSNKAVYKWIRTGMLSGYKFGGIYKITEEDLLRFIKKSRI